MNLKRSLAFVLTLVMLLSLAVPAAFGAEESPLPRIAGDNRIDTAIEISNEGWEDGADAVVLVNGYNYPDALAAVPFAFALEAPILLTEAEGLNSDTAEEIERLEATTVYVIGGEGVVSEAVVDALEELDLDVERIAGDTREETSFAVAEAMIEVLEEEDITVDTAIVAYAHGYADALAAASYAAMNNYPILLSGTDEFDVEAAEDLGIENFIVVGGEAVISDDVVDELDAERIAGDNRFETAVALAEEFGVPNHMFFATGLHYADALTGGVLAAMNGTGIMLVGKGVPDVVADFINDNDITTVTLLGGTAAVGNDVASLIKKQLVVGIGGIVGWSSAETVTIAGKTVEPDVDEGGYFKVTGIAPGAYKVYFKTKGNETTAVDVTVVRDRLTVVDGDAGDPITGFSIQGVVVDKVDGFPLEASILLEVWDEDEEDWAEVGEYSSRDTGIFTLTGLEAGGRYLVTVNCIDGDLEAVYHEQEFDVTLAEDEGVYDLGMIEMTTVDAMTISGTLKNKEGKLIKSMSASVAVEDEFEVADADTWDCYRLSKAPISEESIVVLSDGGNDITDWFEIGLVAEKGPFVRLLEGKTVTKPITVKYETKNLSVELQGLGQVITSGTDKDGKFEFADVTLPTGKYNLVFNYNDGNHAAYNAEISVTEGKDLTHNIALKGGYAIEFELRSSTTATLSGQNVEVELKQGSTVIADDMWDGSFTEMNAVLVAPGTYTIKVTGDHLITQEYLVKITNDDVRLAKQITPAGGIAVSVTHDAFVEILDADGEIVDSAEVEATEVNIFGGLPVGGKYTVRVSADDKKTKHFNKTAEVITIEVNEDNDDYLGITLNGVDTVGQVSGYVRKADGYPAAGAMISYYYNDVAIPDTDPVQKYAKGAPAAATDTVEADGFYSITALDPGVYDVVVRLTNHENFVTTITVKAGDDKEYINYRMVAGGKAELTLVVEDDEGLVDGLTLKDAFGEEITIPAATNDKYTISNLSAGTYTLTRDAAGDYAALKETILIRKGAEVSKSYKLSEASEKYEITFWLVDDEYGDIDNARIFVGDVEAEAEGNGNYTIDLVDGSYTAEIYVEGFLFETVDFTVKEKAKVLPQVQLTPAK